MEQSYSTENRRKFPRFTPKNDLFVLHSHFGKIINIGMGGILFTYAGTKDDPASSIPTKGVLFAKEDDYLVELPFKIVSDTVVHRTLRGKYNIKRRAVVFEDLNPEQVEQLEQFILDNIQHRALCIDRLEIES